MHNGTCTSVNEIQIPCPLHEDYEKVRDNLIKLFSGKTIYDLVKRANNTGNIFI